MNDLPRFQRIVKMIAFHPFDSAENALENINAITEHEITDDLKVLSTAFSFSNVVFMSIVCIYQTFLDSNVPKGKKANKFPLGVVSAQHHAD